MMTKGKEFVKCRRDAVALAWDSFLGKVACGAVSGSDMQALICDRPQRHHGPHRDRYAAARQNARRVSWG